MTRGTFGSFVKRIHDSLVGEVSSDFLSVLALVLSGTIFLLKAWVGWKLLQ
jgi:hypothetical protein